MLFNLSSNKNPSIDEIFHRRKAAWQLRQRTLVACTQNREFDASQNYGRRLKNVLANNPHNKLQFEIASWLTYLVEECGEDSNRAAYECLEKFVYDR